MPLIPEIRICVKLKGTCQPKKGETFQHLYNNLCLVKVSFKKSLVHSFWQFVTLFLFLFTMTMQLMLSHRLNQIRLACVSSSLLIFGFRSLWNLHTSFFYIAENIENFCWVTRKLQYDELHIFGRFYFGRRLYSKNWMKHRFIQINCSNLIISFQDPKKEQMKQFLFLKKEQTKN